MRTRRDFVHLLAGTGAIAALGLYALPARAADGSWDISYLWAPDLDAVLDYRDQVADVLGPDVAKHLTIVKGRSGNWGLVYDRSGKDAAAAKAVATRHDALLRQAMGGRDVLATVVEDEGYSRASNVGYGVVGSMSEARTRFDTVARMLGPNVHRELVIEQPSDKEWQVVYKRMSDATSTAAVAKRHASLLAKKGIPATAVPERHHDPIWGASSGAEEATPVQTRAVASMASTATKAAVLSKATADRGTAAERSKAMGSDLPASISTPLRNAVNKHVQRYRKQGIVGGDETTAWYVHTLHDDRTWCAINADRPLQCASMVKPLVALAFMHQVKKGKLIYGAKSRARHEWMIQRSHNGYTNWCMKQVGGPAAVQRILKREYGHLFKHVQVVEYIPTYGKTYKNRCSAQDYVRFARALWRDELPKSAELKRLMALPGRDRLKTGAPAVPAYVKVMNKTGTTNHACGDFGILVAKSRSGKTIPYAICGIVEKRSRASSFSTWQITRGRLIRGMSNLTYGVLKQHYDLV